MFNLHPLIILVVGMLTVILMITRLRMNAFIALITSAVVVSLLSPGELAEKISRVATEFGNTAGSIGIVIALAVVIGKCMMDSGAADRIVRGFLSLLGEKRSSTALMASGFVLSVPVFFDTVFYLLVPLARSMHRRTKKHYLKYAMAIAAGGVVTHSLVPPTPGPLIMADNLGIDIGVTPVKPTIASNGVQDLSPSASVNPVIFTNIQNPLSSECCSRGMQTSE
ncbi:High-affinity gluconate transporter [subsurface metagenome]